MAPGRRALVACVPAIVLACASGSPSAPQHSSGATGSTDANGSAGASGSMPASAGGGGVVGSGGGGGIVDGGVSSDAGGIAGAPREVEAGPVPDGNPNGDGAASHCPAGALLCDDFENYAVGADLTVGGWIKTETSATIQVDATKPFAGRRGLHLTAPGGGAKYAALVVRKGAPLFPIAGNSFYGRMMVWLTDAPAGVHFNNVIASGTLAGSTAIARYGFGALMAEATAAYTVRSTPTAAPMTDCYLAGGATLPTKHWVCLEWSFDGTKNELHEWFDGSPASDVVKTAGTCAAGSAPVWRAPTFSDVQLGWFQNQPSTVPLEMWIDDIAIVGGQRIGCPAMN